MNQSERYSEFLREIATRYSRDGYEVLIQPTTADRPQFLKKFEPDILAFRDDSKIIVEVKVARSGTSRKRVDRLIKLVEKSPDWRVDMVYYDPGRNNLKPSRPPKIKKSLQEAVELFDKDARVAGLLLAWSALEAAALHALNDKGDDVEPGENSRNLLKRLVFNGLVSDAEYSILLKICDLRNRLAHGMLGEKTSRSQISLVIETTKNLLDKNFVKAA